MDLNLRHSATFAANAASCPAARYFVASLLVDWDLEELSDDAALVVTELATNAIHHTRDRFTVTVGPVGTGVRIDVVDSVPGLLPTTVPTRGTVADLTRSGTTGRGLQIVAALASRWGFSTTRESKDVWVELTGQHSLRPTGPLISIGQRSEPDDCGATLRFAGLPVRSYVAAGMLVDEAVRDVALDLALDAPGMTTSERRDSERLLELMERTAPIRSVGRHAALLAGAAGRTRFAVEVTVTDAILRSLGELRDALSVRGGLSDHRGVSRRWMRSQPEQDQRTDGVPALRAWLDEETARQLAGASPTPCPLPAPVPPDDS